MGITKELLEILACPKCKGSLTQTPSEDGLICSVCRLIYPIHEDIPMLLIEGATSF